MSPLIEEEVANPAVRTTAAPRDLRSHVRRGAVWNVMASTSSQVIQLGSTAVLARLLSPTDYGLAGLVAVVTGLAAIFVDLGITTAVVRSPRLTERFLASAFALNLAVATLMTVLVCLAAAPAADALGEPGLTGLILLSSVTFLLQFNAIHTALMQRAMRFPELARFSVVTLLVSTAVTLALAAAGAGPVSLVLGTIASRLVSLVQVQRAVRWWPRGRPSRAHMADLWRFGRALTGSSLVGYLVNSADRIIIGARVDAAAVGYWGRATNLSTLPLSQSSGVLDRVFLSAMSTMTQDGPRLKRTWLLYVRASWLVGMPLGAGMAVTAPAFVRTVYGDGWDPVIPVLTLVAAAIPFWLLGSTMAPVYEALGRTSLQFVLTSIDAVLYLLMLLIGIQYGLIGVAVATLVRGPVSSLLSLAPLTRMIGLRLGELCAALWRSAALTVVMVAVLLVLTPALGDLPVGIVLLVQVATGGAVYGTGAWFLERATILRLAGRGERPDPRS